MDKLSYEEWQKENNFGSKELVAERLSVEERESFLLKLEEILEFEYQVYLCGGWDAIHEHNRIVSDMQCDPTCDPSTIPPLWPILNNGK